MSEEVEQRETAFKIREASADELLEWVLACQLHDPSEIRVIEPKGLRIVPTPFLSDDIFHEVEWIPTGKKSGNEWRLK